MGWKTGGPEALFLTTDLFVLPHQIMFILSYLPTFHIQDIPHKIPGLGRGLLLTWQQVRQYRRTAVLYPGTHPPGHPSPAPT